MKNNSRNVDLKCTNWYIIHCIDIYKRLLNLAGFNCNNTDKKESKNYEKRLYKQNTYRCGTCSFT